MLAKYFPIKGKYEITAGLKPLGYDFGNGSLDSKIFQFDDHFMTYHDSKLSARSENPSKYHQIFNLDANVMRETTKFILKNLCDEYYESFLAIHSSDGTALHCKRTGETLLFDADFNLRNDRYANSLDALMMQVQEDIAILTLKDGREYVSALHVCSPNYWSPQEVIGGDFNKIHRPVAGFEKIKKASDFLVQIMIYGTPTVRFAWGLSTDNRLNHHPIAPAQIDQKDWTGREFDPKDPKLYLRVERQVSVGLPNVDSALFIIRTYLTDCNDLSKDQRKSISDAISTMSLQQKKYKGLEKSCDDIITFLQGEILE